MKEKLKLGILSVLEAGAKISAIYETDFKVNMKGENDPVTLADMESHFAIKDTISKYFPDDLLLSEEEIPTWEERSTHSKIWILDPLDGTRDFVNKNPEFAVSLGYVENSVPKFGILFNPISRELFYGGESFPFFSDKLVSDQDPKTYVEALDLDTKDSSTNIDSMNTDSSLKIYVSKNEWKEDLFEFLKKDSHIEVIGIGSIAYKLGLLARSDCDIVLSLKPKNEWDICAGVAILHGMNFSYFDLEKLSPHRFNNKDTKSLGFIAGESEKVQTFLSKYKDEIQAKLRDW